MKTKTKNIIFLIFTLAFLSSCNEVRKLETPENKYGTGGQDLSVFHKISENDLGLSLRFPGYIVGIEKAYRKDLGIPNWSDNLQRSNFNSEKSYEKMKSFLDDSKRTFVSHTKRYYLKKDKGNLPYIKEDIKISGTGIPSIYDKRFRVVASSSYPTVYEKSYETLELLKKQIEADIYEAKEKDEKYTHVFLYSMGWNTDQQESFRNFNSLMTQMIENKTVTHFKPLFVGISWPSEWSWDYFEGLGKAVSYPTKAEDADEVGFLWGHKILREILIPIKQENEIPLVVVGHSFGARLLSRAVFSQPMSKNPLPSEIDLFVGIQGAVSVNRFINGKGWEGYPYENYEHYARKFIFTWSEHDSANPLAAWFTQAELIGGSVGFEKSKKYPAIFDQFKVIVNSGTDHNYDLEFNRIENTIDWSTSFNQPNKISMIDASELIKNVPYGKGGKAHSDIYTPGVAKLIWDAMDHL